MTSTTFYRTQLILGNVIDACSQQKNFRIFLDAKSSKIIVGTAPYYQKFCDAYVRKKSKKTIRILISFFIRAVWAPTFWCSCIYAEHESNRSMLQVSEDGLSFFYFFEQRQ